MRTYETAQPAPDVKHGGTSPGQFIARRCDACGRSRGITAGGKVVRKVLWHCGDCVAEAGLERARKTIAKAAAQAARAIAKAQHNAYQQSPEGRAAASRRERERRAALASLHDAHVREYQAAARSDAHVLERAAFFRRWFLAERCVMEGRHALWTRQVDGRSRPRVELFGHRWGNGRRLAYSALNCCNIPQGHEVYPACGQPLCLAHLKAGDRSTRMKLQFAQGIIPRPSQFPGCITARRARSTFSMDKAREMRRVYAEERPTKTALGKRFGVSRQFVAKVVTNKLWREGALPNASVFAYAAAVAGA